MTKHLQPAGTVVFLVSVLLLCAALTSMSPAAEFDFLLEARPGTLIVARDSGEFRALGPSPLEPAPGHGTLTVLEEAGGLATFPNVRLGVGAEVGKAYADVTVGGGILVTERFRSLMASVDGSLQYKFRKNISIGPHLGLAYFDTPQWSGDAEIEFSDSWGILGGMELAVWYDILFVFCVDYFYIEPFDVTVRPPWEVTDTQLDFTGPSVQFGLRGRF
ncbi:MAG: hypothetical protein V1873_05305 [Verrucomicrobiota bacterium]